MSHEHRHTGNRHVRDSEYLERIHPDIGPVLQSVEAEAIEDDQPITERTSTRLLSMLVRLGAARHALEIGTNIGYSAIAIASALQDGGRLTTLDYNPSLQARAWQNAMRAGVSDRIEMVPGPALDTLTLIEGPFDFAYIDADKESYPQYLDAVLDRLRPGGVVAIDNLLWLGHAAHDPEDGQPARESTSTIRAFNRAFLADARIESTILQIGDGVGVGIKRHN